MAGHWGDKRPNPGGQVRGESGPQHLHADRKDSVPLPKMESFCTFMLFFWI